MLKQILNNKRFVMQSIKSTFITAFLILFTSPYAMADLEIKPPLTRQGESIPHREFTTSFLRCLRIRAEIDTVLLLR